MATTEWLISEYSITANFHVIQLIYVILVLLPKMH